MHYLLTHITAGVPWHVHVEIRNPCLFFVLGATLCAPPSLPSLYCTSHCQPQRFSPHTCWRRTAAGVRARGPRVTVGHYREARGSTTIPVAGGLPKTAFFLKSHTETYISMKQLPSKDIPCGWKLTCSLRQDQIQTMMSLHHLIPLFTF